MTPSTKLTQLRRLLVQHQIDGFIIQRGDEYLNEYVAPYAERLSWLTGFAGSAGLALVLEKKAAVFSDGRYILQMQQELDSQCWEHYHISQNPPVDWILSEGKNTLKIGYDPRLMSEKDLKSFAHPNITMIPVNSNLVDAIWVDQPPPPSHPIVPHPVEFSGLDHQNKIKTLQEGLIKYDEDAYIFCDPASICWLLNIRGSDVPYTPIPLVYAIITQNHVSLYADSNQYSQDLTRFLGNNVILQSHANLEKDLETLKGKKIGFDPVQTPIWFIQTLKLHQAILHPRENPCMLSKACKNPVEQEGARQAHLRDGIAVCRFLYWLEHEGIGHNEIEVAHRLNEFRKAAGGTYYQEESFPAISGVGANGAIIHYHASPQHCAVLQENQAYLIDSGGQYLDGTTDVTRTVWLGTEKAPVALSQAATAVLKGHIALSSVIFPKKTTGSRLDVLARYALWQKGLDYDHGTGHGVGSYLSVHEGPCRISSLPFPIALQKGMILSNEPGYYLLGQYGIRLENLLLVIDADFPNFLQFEPLTLIPFDLKIISKEDLSSSEKEWLNAYHYLVMMKISPFLSKKEQEWLAKICSPIT
ncbi:aminopeptidase P family protein [Commensalibacter oyaizuii]|uniref:Aminopeptidase P family protein n=1 Tax=Commensalibacter oyaizuii TaxID=3043873 RepID=A0ABT6PZB2_9PROT|nr:aminopeptidase P family protein [Commensalibacter sp. TBRC 16381]MDI2090200.1 aminopeptidase P family protein [Commensalibacter sp. TBRC 16381]